MNTENTPDPEQMPSNEDAAGFTTPGLKNLIDAWTEATEAERRGFIELTQAGM